MTHFPEPSEVVRQLDPCDRRGGGFVRRVTVRLDDGRLVSYFEACIPGGNTVACDAGRPPSKCCARAEREMTPHFGQPSATATARHSHPLLEQGGKEAPTLGPPLCPSRARLPVAA
jgi:hypothetical protein